VLFRSKPKEAASASLTSFFPIEANVNPVVIQRATKEQTDPQFLAPLSALTSGQYQFIGGPKQPEQKAKGETLERKRGGVLTASEEAIIGGTPAFLNAPVAPSFAFLG